MAIRSKEHQISTIDLLYIVALICILGNVLISFTNGIGVTIGDKTEYIKLNYSFYKDNNRITFGNTYYDTKFAPFGLFGLFLPVIGGFLGYMINNPKHQRRTKIIASIIGIILIIAGIVASALYPLIWIGAQNGTPLKALIDDGSATISLYWTQYAGMVLALAAAVLMTICLIKMLKDKPV